MILYAESSAVLAWLLGEPTQQTVLNSLRSADRVVTSALTALECGRALNRAGAEGRVSKSEMLAALRLLDVAESGWDVLDLSERVLSRARSEFPVEPVRSPDALHLASALEFHEAFGAISLLSFDERIRANGSAFGMTVVPN